MKRLLLVLLLTGVASSSARLLAGSQAGRHLLSPQQNGMNFNAQINDAVRQEKKAVMVQHIEKAAAAGGAKDMTNHATAAGTRDGADVAGGAVGHTIDRRRLLSPQQSGMNINAQINDAVRQEKKAVMVQHIEKAAAAGGAKDQTSHATAEGTRDGADVAGGAVGHTTDRRRLRGAEAVMFLEQSGPTAQASIRQPLATGARKLLQQQVTQAVPLRVLQQASETNTGMGDSLRSIQNQNQAAVTTSLIRRAASGQVDVAEAIRVAQTPATKSSLVAASTASAAVLVADGAATGP